MVLECKAHAASADSDLYLKINRRIFGLENIIGSLLGTEASTINAYGGMRMEEAMEFTEKFPGLSITHNDRVVCNGKVTQ